MNTDYAHAKLGSKPAAIASPNPLKKYQFITVSLLLVIGIINYVDRSALSIANTSIQRDLQITPSEMGILLSAFSLAYALAQLPLGVIIDRLGSKLSLGAALLGWSIAQTASGLINSFSTFIGLRVLLGIGEAPMFPSAAKALSDWFDAEKRGITVDQLLAERAKLNPAGRFGDPEEFGQACAFLCGAKAGFITGQVISVSGGLTMHG